MEVNFGGNKIVPYSKRQWEDYQARMMAILPMDAATGDQIAADTEFKNFVAKFVFDQMEDPILKETNHRNGITFRLANMEVSSPEGTVMIPLVNEYKGHYVKQSHYFKKEKGAYVVKTIEVVPTSIIIPT